MKRILITGGAGFIGSNLALKLIDKGYTVRVLDNLSEQIHGSNPEIQSPLYNSIKDKVEFIRGTVISSADWAISLKDVDVVVHLAAETGTGQSMYEINRYCEVNIQGTSILLDYLTNNENQVRKVIIASSRAIYGEGKYYSEKYGMVYPEQRSETDMKNGIFNPTYLDDKELRLLATDEDSKIHPTSIYGITKQVQEQLVLTTCRSLNLDCCSFRYQNVYGPGQSLKNPYTGILSIFTGRILNGLPINIFEDGLESRDFVYIDDVVDATIKGIEYNTPIIEAFNVGTGINVSVSNVVALLMENYKIYVDVNISGNFRIGDIRHNYADVSKINRILNFNTKYDFESGLKKFGEWVLTQPIEQSNYEKSLEEMKAKGLFK